MLPPVNTAADVTFRESGRKDAPALVLLHGIGSTSAGWRLQYEPLGRHCRVIAWDAPGYGGSKPLAGDAPGAAAYALALARLLDALGVPQAVIGTNSWGTPTGVVFARLFPQRVRGLVLGGPAAGWGALPREERDKRVAARLERVRALGMKKMREEDSAELVVPRPSWPKLFCPQPQADPDESRARLKFGPALIAVMLLRLVSQLVVNFLTCAA